MPIYNVTFGFRGQGVGWSESHAYKSQYQSPNQFVPTCQLVAQKRVKFLGREFEIHMIRISLYSDDTATNRLKGVFLHKEIYTNPVRTVSMAAEPAVVALIGRGQTSAGIAPEGFAANQNRTFLGAPPDPCVDNAGVVDPSKSDLGVNFDSWKQALMNGWGWLASKTVAQAEIDVIEQRPDGTVEFTTQAPNPNNLQVGTIYKARCRRVNAGNSPLNGELIVKYTAANTFVTQEVIGLALAQTGGVLRLYAPISPFIPFWNMQLDLETGKHQRGRPFGSIPGRQRKRIRG